MNQLKIKAIKLRENGCSYGMIKNSLGISKSTLSNWLSSIPFKPNQEVINRIGEARLKSAIYKQTVKFEDINRRKNEAKQEIGKLSTRDLFMLGVGLYLGEGSKALEEIRIVNSDPAIIKLSIKWLKEACNLNIKNFKITVHDYPDNDLDYNVRFWSEETGLPIEQFGKTVVDTRKNKSTFNKRKLPYGTAHLYVRSGGTIFPGVKSLHRKIIGWIEAITQQI